MANKRIKKRVNYDSTKTYNGSDFDTKKTNTTRKKKNTKKKKNTLWIIWGALCALVLILTLIKMGILATVAVAILVTVMTGLIYLLSREEKNPKKRKIKNITLIAMLILFILMLIFFGIFLVYITITAPKFDETKLNTKELSIIYDKDGNEVTKIGAEKREKVSYDELPQVLVDAIVATEDSRFFTHNGFDAPRFIRASIGQALGRSSAGGASTLSMQVVKNSLTSTESSGIKGIIRKFTDIYLAIFKLEKQYSKEQIIEFYVNNHSLGGNIYGVEEASKAYFGKDVSDLNLSEAAIIAGMFKAPNYYKPTANPENAEQRRRNVLYYMRIHGYITEEQEKAANEIPVESLTGNSTGGIITSDNEYQDYIDTVVEEMQEKYEVDPYSVSVKIYTNLDKSKQNAINDIMSGKTYEWKDDQIQSGISVLDSATGKILAIGAGRNRKISGYNFATQGKRQPGSTAKPLFDYGPGIEYNNWSTYQLFVDEPYTYSNGRTINNWDRSYMGTMTLRRALSLSRNIPALKAFQQVDNKKIIEFVQSLGIEPEISNDRIHEAHSIGAFTGVNSLQMAAAYAAFSNGGYYNEPYAVEKFTYRQSGETVKHKGEKKKVMSDATAYMITSVLQDVQLTGGSLENVAQKTGTTNFDEAYMKANNLPSDAIRDSWVVGYSSKTVIGMWYGYNTASSEYCLRNVPATIAKDKLFKTIATGVLEKNREAFKMPDTVVKLGIIAGSNPPKVAPSGYSGSVVYELFKKDHLPNSTGSTDEENTSLDKPSGLKGSYENGKITLTWNGVNGSNNENYGDLGYNIYLGDTLLTFTTDTSYTYTLKSSDTGQLTFKVVASYRSYSGLSSEAATINVNVTKKETETINYTINYYCGDNNFETKQGSKKLTDNETIATITLSDIPTPTASIPDACENAIAEYSKSVSNGGSISVKYTPKVTS